MNLAAAFVLGLATSAYDQTGHETVLFAVARHLGFSPKEAAVVASSSQSLDEHKATTAFTMEKILDEIKDVRAGTYALKDAPHMLSGQVFHALTEHRKEVEQAHHDRIQRELKRGNRELALLYLGQYLHFAADLVTHPTDPMFGHAKDAHHPDRGEENGAKLRAMMALMQEKLEQFQAKDLKPTDFEKVKRWSEARPGLPPVLEKVARTVEDAWIPSKAQQRAAVWKSRDVLNLLDVGAMMEREKAALVRTRVLRTLSEETGVVERFEPRVIPLDGDGEPPEGMFGYRRSIEELPFGSLVAQRASLAQEREARAKDYVGLALGLGVIVLKNVPSETVPFGPGGVALDPDLELPAGIGEPKEITLAPSGVVLVTSRGTWLLEGVHARSFATILRCVAGGEIPYVTIGSAHSDRPGWARVQYARGIRGTVEGDLLYRADAQFKSIFAGLPFGDQLQVRVDGWPGIGGESTRLWITASGIQLEAEGDRLRVVRPGMRINGETRLLGDVISDPALDAFAAGLTARWSELAAATTELKAMETLALECAIALWALREGVRVHEAIWSIPPARAVTPDYAPVVLSSDGISGGVTLLPEDNSRALGREALRAWRSKTWIGTFLVALALALGPVAWLRWRQGKPGARAIGIALGAHLALGVVLGPAVWTRGLGAADRDFMAYLWLAAAPCLFAWTLRRAGLAGRRNLALGALGLPLASAATSVVMAMLIAGLAGRTAGPITERTLGAALGPANLLGAATGSLFENDDGETVFVPAPRSLQLSIHGFEVPSRSLIPFDGSLPLELHGGPSEGPLPWTRLMRVESGAQPRTGALYTVNGRPPY